MKNSIEYSITEKSIAQGDLVLIINNERPTKSGWWRKIVGSKGCNSDVYYILEKPMHKGFNANDETLAQTHIENGLFIMKAKTLYFTHDRPASEYYNDKKYDILVDVRGTDAIKLIHNNYDLTSLNLNSQNIRYSEEFLKLMEHYNNIEESNKWKNIASNLI